MKLALSIFAVLSLAGCATILNDETQKINVGSANNTEFKGTIDGIPFSGPGVIAVKRTKADKIIMVDTPACQKQNLLASTVDPKFFINILSGGTFGSSTDYATEKMWKYQDTVLIPCK
jgi:uncharacterized protein YceK